jgi:hypothetical protein
MRLVVGWPDDGLANNYLFIFINALYNLKLDGSPDLSMSNQTISCEEHFCKDNLCGGLIEENDLKQ